MKLAGAFLGGAVAAVLIAVAVMYFADLEVVDKAGSGEGSELISVPNVLGQSTPDAEGEISSAGLEPDSDYDEQSGFWRSLHPIDETTIGTQSPDPGIEVEPDTIVRAFVK